MRTLPEVSEQRQTCTIDSSGQLMTIEQDGVSMPADYSFTCVNDYVHDTGRHFEELQGLALGMACEIERLRAEVEALRGLMPEPSPRQPDGVGLPRYGLRWNGPQQPLSVPMADGYWTPWHLAYGEIEALRKALNRIADRAEAFSSADMDMRPTSAEVIVSIARAALSTQGDEP